MPRRNRCVLPGVAYHITQRGVNNCDTFSTDGDRRTYLSLLQQYIGEAEVAILAYCLMTNHVHLVALPGREDSLSVLCRRVHGRYAQYYNARSARTGHLWQSRFFACALEGDHLWTALRYVELNPVRAGMVDRAGNYRWSSAVAHLTGNDASEMLDMEWWRREAPSGWDRAIAAGVTAESDAKLRQCTYSGHPFGSDSFVTEMSERFGRYWGRGRPPRMKVAAVAARTERDQFRLF